MSCCGATVDAVSGSIEDVLHEILGLCRSLANANDHLGAAVADLTAKFAELAGEDDEEWVDDEGCSDEEKED